VGTHPRQQLTFVEGLRQVVDRPELEPLNDALHIILGGEKDDGNVARLRIGLQPATDLVAIHVWHHDVEQDELKRARRGPLQRSLSVGRELEGVPLIPQDVGQELDVLGLVVDDQDLEAVACHRPR
jgi:hypothetical protein